ncbi:MAG: hypothetical protein M1826_004492 [Phylliscum demangeonii]|nr:MAG: hypothetical protein M1826_004492 [Phylliscum demangeonii]
MASTRALQHMRQHATAADLKPEISTYDLGDHGLVLRHESLPELKATIQISPHLALSQSSSSQDLSSQDRKTSWYGVQFCPNAAAGADPLVAVTGGSETVILRLRQDDADVVDVVHVFRDDDGDAGLKCCLWIQDPASGHPCLAVAGTLPKIDMLEIKTGRLVRTLVGHGNTINDLALSPISTTIIASGSEDATIRLWTLEDRYRWQPCAVICAGPGQRESVLTIAFHASGRYLLSGGMDCRVNLWTLPDLPNHQTGTDKPTVLYAPHFSTAAIHGYYVDCVLFFHDLVLSRCAREGKIVLWRIDGFHSDQSPPTPDEAPTSTEYQATLTSFGEGYERLLQFETPHADPFPMRFGLFQAPFREAILAMGNTRGTVFFWAFDHLRASLIRHPASPEPATRKRRRSSSADGKMKAPRANVSTSISTSTSPADIDLSHPIPAHQLVDLKKDGFVMRQLAWSVGGEWMVAVGGQGGIAVFHRPLPARAPSLPPEDWSWYR